MDVADVSPVGLEDASTGLQPTQKHLCGLEVHRPDRDFKHRGTPMHFQDNRFPYLPTERPDRLKFHLVSCNDFVSGVQACCAGIPSMTPVIVLRPVASGREMIPMPG